MTPARPEDTANLRDQLAAAARRAESLRAVIASISGELELQPLLTRVVVSAAELLDAPFGSIGLVVETPDGPASGPAASHNLSLLNGNVLLPAGVGLTGKVLLDQAPVRLDRYDALQRPVRDDIADHAVIAVPIWWAGSIAGIFSLAAPPPRRFSDDDVAMLEQFADHAAIAITNARLFEAERRRAERTATLTEIGRILTSNLSLDALLRTAVETLAAHLHRHTVAIMLVDPDDPETLVLRSRGGVYAVSNLDGYRQSIHVGTAGAAARARRTILVNDVRTDPRYIPVSAGSALRAELAIPLLVGQRLLGLLNIESEQPFSDEDAESFAIVAGQLAVAIENAKLFAATHDALDEARLLYETSRRIGTAHDIDGVVQAYLEQVAASNRYSCSVVTYEFGEEGRPAFVHVRGRWSPSEGFVREPVRYRHSRDAFDPDLDAGLTVTIDDYRTDPRLTEAFRRVLIDRGAPAAMALIPLIAGGRRLGLVLLGGAPGRPWTDTVLHPYRITAAQLAAAIDSRRQHELLAENGRRLAVLEERQRLARELHDAVIQSVFGVALIAQSIAPMWKRDRNEAERRIERLVDQSRQAVRELRGVLEQLQPSTEPVLPAAAMRTAAANGSAPEHDLTAEFATLAALLRDVGMAAEVDLAAYTRQEREIEHTLYRVAQEGVSNAMKHARARRVAIRLATEGEVVRLTLVDDGDGFAVSESAGAQDGSQDGGGFGLDSMRGRAERIGGTVRVRSTPGQGTTVEAILPRRDREV